MSKVKILIIIPAYNEEESIAQTIHTLHQWDRAHQVLVVNDGSTDSTEKAALSTGVCVLSLPFNLGIGGAVQTGYLYAKENDFDIAVQFDADGQHDAKFLDDLIDPIIHDGADISIGSRFIPPYLGYRSSFVRRFGIHFFAFLISLITGVKVTDPTSGFRACSRSVICDFSKNYPVDYPEPEAIVLARKLQRKIVEVPVKMNKRSGGHSSIRYFRTCYYMIKVTFAILLDQIKPING